MAAADTAKLIAELSLRDKLSPGLRTASKNLGKFETGLGRAGKGVGQVAGGIARAGAVIGTAAVAGLGVAAKAAIDWEDAFAGVVKTVDEADLAAAGLTFEELGRSIRDMSLEMPIAATELATIAETAGALGIKAADIEAFTRQVAILGSTTNVTTDEAATALGQLQNVIGLTGDEFDNFAAALVDLGNKGASTESQILEIARRSGAAASLIGVAKDQTLGWASAAANLGLNEELAGTALQNFFVKTATVAADGGKKLEMLADTAGLTTKQFKKAFEEDATGALTTFLEGLGELESGERIKRVQKVFGKGSGLTRLILGLADSIDTNLDPSLRTSAEAWDKGTAAAEEFEKRNQTVRSAITRLKNGLTDAAVTVGEGFTPALGEASDSLAKFLKEDKNRKALQQLGKDIGEAIRGVKWNEVLDGAREFIGVMKGALTVAKSIFDVFNALPTEIKATAAGLLALNKVSGGLLGAGVGNIIGGLGETLARSAGSKLPGVGKLFAQPVFVTNWPLGGLGGGVGAAAGKGGGAMGLLTKALPIAAIVASVAAVWSTQADESNKNSEFAASIKTGLDSSIAGKTMPELKTALGGVQQGIKDITSNPLLTLVQGEALTTLQAMEGSLQSQIAKVESLKSQAERTKDDTIAATYKSKAAVEESKRETSRGLTLVKSAAERTRDAALETKREAARGLAIVNSATRSGTSQVVGAIQANRPLTFVTVNVSGTSIKQSVDVKNRTGKSGGSRNNNTDGSGTLGNGGR